MICPNCQTELQDGTKFCSSCGTPLAGLAQKAEEVVAEVKEEIPAAGDVIPAAVDDLSSDMPSASFDPGAPIAIPKQVEENIDVATEFPMEAPEVAPIENVLPEYPQTVSGPVDNAAAPVVEPFAAPAQETVAAPVLAPAPQLTPAGMAAPIPAPIPQLTPETVPAPVVPAKDPLKEKKQIDTSDQKILKTGTAFWLSLLFAIPVIGLIFAIVLSAAGKKCQSRKNFARAALIWQIILICIILSLVIVCHFLAPDLFDAFVNGTAYDVIDELDKIIPFIA